MLNFPASGLITDLQVTGIPRCSFPECARITFVSDMPIWSKLESGRLPNPNELHQIIENQLKFSPGH